MGIIVEGATFDAPAPTASSIAARVSEILGLQSIVQNSPPEIRGTLYDLHAKIALTSYPKDEIKLQAYRAGAVKEHLRLAGMDTLPVAKMVQGSKEAPGKQAVFVEGYVGQEPTLLFATLIALESLGGVLDEPMSEDIRRRYGRSISPGELRRRHRKTQWRGILTLTTGVLLLPVLVPIWFVTFAWFLIMMPRRIWKARQRMKKHHRDQQAGRE